LQQVADGDGFIQVLVFFFNGVQDVGVLLPGCFFGFQVLGNMLVGGFQMRALRSNFLQACFCFV